MFGFTSADQKISTPQCVDYKMIVLTVATAINHDRAYLSLQVHSNNMFTRGVKIFSSVSCWFKPRLISSWEPTPVVFNTVLDDKNPSARYVTVPLNRRVAKSLRCRFFFADIWMMFSEISFQSGSNTHAHTHTFCALGSEVLTNRNIFDPFTVHQRTPFSQPK